MKDAWNDMRVAKEESYFEKKNREALERLKIRETEKPRLSPITGEPMEQVTMNGVVVDVCKTSKGIWLDAGELEQLIDAVRSERSDESAAHWLNSFFNALSGKQK